MRKHLVQKIIQTIFPTQDHNIYKDPRLANLVQYAVKTECEMYEQARDQEEYFHLLAERIYKIQKEFEDKQRTRNINKINNTTTTSTTPLATAATTGGTIQQGPNVAGAQGNSVTGITSDLLNSGQQPMIAGLVNGVTNNQKQTMYSQLQSLNAGKYNKRTIRELWPYFI